MGQCSILTDNISKTYICIKYTYLSYKMVHDIVKITSWTGIPVSVKIQRKRNQL